MGNRTVQITAAACIAVLSASGHAFSQVVGTGADTPPEAVPAAPAPPSTAKSSKSRAKADLGTQSLSPSPVIVYRPPVRREVPPRQSKARGADTPTAAHTPPVQTDKPAPPASAAPTTTPAAISSANASTASDASAAAAGRKSWPVIIQAQTAAGAAAAASAGAAAPAAVATWSEQEIKQAKAHCTAVLAGVDAIKVAEDPIKQGECGSPVLFKVSSVSKSPAVELSPPVLLTCDMVASLDKWIKRDVQPQARALLGGSIIKIDTMSSYSCRNAYGRTKSRLSEHGKANAIDIASFSTAKDTTTVLAGWGLTVRELKVIAAAKAEAERVAAQKAAGGTSGTLPRVITPPASGGVPVPSIPGVIISGPNGPRLPPNSALGVAPAHLGGPKAQDGKPASQVAAGSDTKMRFLKEIHAAACKHFGTVLGPEANNAHKNHFHLDMAPRQRANFCE